MDRSSNKEIIRSRTRSGFVLCAVCIAVNVIGSLPSTVLGFPLYLDSIGTIFAAAVGGFVPGIITGFLTNFFKGFFDLSSVYYIPINIMLALATAFYAKRDRWTRFPQVLWALLLRQVLLPVTASCAIKTTARPLQH